jgi:hypothetical protein
MVGFETKDNPDDPGMKDPADAAAKEPLRSDHPLGVGLALSPLAAAAHANPALAGDFSPAPVSSARGSSAARPASAPAPDARKRARIFSADIADGDDAFGLTSLLRPLAELAVHRDAQTPLTIGLLGGAGAGKSFALNKLLSAIDELSNDSINHSRVTSAGDNFLRPVLTVRVDSIGLSEAPLTGLAIAVYDKLAAKFPELAGEAAHSVRDPHIVAREAADELDIGRRRLDTERQNLAEIESRRARLPELILFEQAGSQVDSYARANRAKIENRLQGFGLNGDTIQNYKSLVRDIAESGGQLARIGAALRAFWAFKGQTRLLVTALIFVLVAIGCDAAVAQQSVWLDWLRHLNQAFAPTADWLGAHIGWLAVLKQLAWLAACAAVAVNLWRGIRFLRPLFRGVGLLEAEVANRRHDLDSLYAHQMQRVDAIAADVELIGRRAAEAERRVANSGARKDQAEPSPFDTMTAQTRATRFFAALATAIESGWDGSGPISASVLPRRIVIGLDNIDRLAPAQIRELLDAMSSSLGKAAFVTVVAAEPDALARAVTGGAGDDAEVLQKWIQIPFNVGTRFGEDDCASLVAQAVDPKSSAAAANHQQAPIDWTLAEDEVTTLKSLARLAGASPRAVKRFVNLYRVARTQTSGDRPLVAFMLALDQDGSDVDRAFVDAALAGEDDGAFDLRQSNARLSEAFADVQAMQGPVDRAAARRAAAIAKTYSLRT